MAHTLKRVKKSASAIGLNAVHAIIIFSEIIGFDNSPFVSNFFYTEKCFYIIFFF